MICFIINGPMQHIANQPEQLLFFFPPFLSDKPNSSMSQSSWPVLAIAVNVVWLSISIIIGSDQTE